MKKRVLSLFLAAAFFAVSVGHDSLSVSAGENTVKRDALIETALEGLDEVGSVQGEAIVTFHSSGDAALAHEGLYSANPFLKVEKVSDFGDDGDGHLYVARVSSKIYDTEELIGKLANIGYVEGVQANTYSKIESQSTAYQWYLSGSTDKVFTKSVGVKYDKVTATPKDTPVVAVIDTGIDYTNKDLVNRLWVNTYSELKGTYGYDTGDGDDDPADYIGHGTHVAGVIAAQDDNYGIKGLSDSRIMSIKITQGDTVDITSSSIVEAIEYVYKAKTLGVNVCAVNCSLGGGLDSGGAIEKAIETLGKEGVLTVFAAGNDGVDVAEDFTTLHMMPYCFSTPYIVTVGSVNEDDERSGFSNYSSDYVDLFAPGSNILSDYIEALYLPQFASDEERNNSTVYYNKFDDSSDNILPGGSDELYIAADIGVPSYYSVSVKKIDDEGFSDSKKDGCILLDVTKTTYPNYNNCDALGYHDYQGDGFEEGGSIYIDVTDLDLDQSSTYYMSALVGYEDGGTMDWETINMMSTREASRFYNVGDRVYFRLIGLSMEYGSGVMYLDDIAVSKADIDESCLSKLYLMSGTSMACPVVTAAVATLAACNPGSGALEIKEHLVDNCIRKSDTVKKYCFSGGILDMSGMGKITKLISVSLIKINPTYKKISFSRRRTLKIRVSISPKDATNRKLAWSSSNKKYATVNKSGKVFLKKAGVGHIVKITVKATDGSGKKAVCRIKITK